MFPKLIEIAYAQVAQGTAISSGELIKRIVENIVNPFITLLVAVAVIYFLWGVFVFVRNADNSDERQKGGMHMLWGAIGLFIMGSAYGIINLILGTIGPK